MSLRPEDPARWRHRVTALAVAAAVLVTSAGFARAGLAIGVFPRPQGPPRAEPPPRADAGVSASATRPGHPGALRP